MAVTTTNTLKLSDVCNELYGSTSTSGKSLIGCHNSAISLGGLFHSSYAVVGNTLLDFRGFKVSPVFSTQLTYSNITQNSIDFAWQTTDNIGVTAQLMTYSGSTVSVSSNATSYTLTGLSPDTTYSVFVTAFDSNGNSTNSVQWGNLKTSSAADTTAPVFINDGYGIGMYISDEGNDSLTCSWSVTDNIGVDSHRIYWRPNSTGSYSSALINPIAGSRPDEYNHLLTGLASNTSYEVYVRVCDAAGNCTNSTTYTRSTSGAADTTAPIWKSTTLTVTGETTSSIGLSWTGATDNVGVTGYSVWKHSGATGTFTLHASLSSGTLSYNVTGLSSDTQYVFYIKATDAAGNTSNTNTASQYTTAAASLSISPTTRTSVGSGESFALNVFSNTSWTLSDNQTWISTNAISGTGNAGLTVAVEPNSGAQRSGVITFNTTDGSIVTTCTITQSAGAVSGTVYTKSLGKGTSACTASKSTYYVDNQYFAQATKLYITSSGKYAFSGSYSDGFTLRYWDSRSGSFYSSEFCGGGFEQPV